MTEKKILKAFLEKQIIKKFTYEKNQTLSYY